MGFKKFLVSHPSAWAPLVMSLGAIILVYGMLLLVGVPQERPADEGTVAHLFQILILGQVPSLLYFVINWGSKEPQYVFKILILQILVILLACAPVFILKF